MIPRIGLTTSPYPRYQGQKLRDDYVRLLAEAGGLPLLLPAPPLAARLPGGLPALAAAAIGSLDGLLLSGGGDYPPQWWGGPGWQAPTARDSWELALLDAAWQRRLPMLGICRGWQGLALSQGGRLIGELRGQGGLGHSQKQPRQQVSHSVSLRGPLAQLYGRSTLAVNSFHHQAVSALPPGWLLAAQAPDGVIEAGAAADRFALGVQWHPEALHDPTLFAALVSAAATI